MGFFDEIEVATTIDIGHYNAATILVIKVTIAIAIPINFDSVSHAMTAKKSAKKLLPFLFFTSRRRRGCAKLASSVIKQTNS